MMVFKSLLWTMSLMGWSVLALLLYAEEKAAPSEEIPLIPRQLLFGNPEKTSPKLSPDGAKLAYIAPDANNVLNVWVRDLQHPEQDRQVTSDQKRGIRSFFWQFDNEHILYIQDSDGDEKIGIFTKPTLNRRQLKT